MNPRSSNPARKNLRILTWNVGKKEQQRDLAVATIARINADIVFLQEPTEAWQKHLCQWLEKRYPYTDFHIDKQRSGSGLSWFSKFPMHNVAFVPSPAGWHGGWIKSFDTPLGRVQILGVHLRPPLNDNERFTLRAFFTSGNDRIAEVREYLKHTKPNIPLIVMGDFNAADRSRAVKYLVRQNMSNALPQFSRFAKTWQQTACWSGIGLRLDHILYTPDLHCRHIEVVRVRPSDHQPVVADFSVKQ